MTELISWAHHFQLCQVFFCQGEYLKCATDQRRYTVSSLWLWDGLTWNGRGFRWPQRRGQRWCAHYQCWGRSTCQTNMTIISNKQFYTKWRKSWIAFLLITKWHLNPFSLESVKLYCFGKNFILYSARKHENCIIIIMLQNIPICCSIVFPSQLYPGLHKNHKTVISRYI